jgi:fumarylacetoacetase
LFEAMRSDAPASTVDVVSRCLVAQHDAEFALPVDIGDYTDFYTSVHHATNIGKLFRPDSPLAPNFHWVPVGYHGRVSSIGTSGQRFRRPWGQIVPAGRTEPVHAPCERLDYELELGIFIGVGNAQGEPIALADAQQHVFGLCLLNDWSARDIQVWESAPLGPFLAKNFATTLSPWIVTMEALAPYRQAWTRAANLPQPLAYLEHPHNREAGAIDVQLEVSLETAQHRATGMAPSPLSRTSFRHQHWSVAQMVAHHSSGGCNLRAGDLLGSGTISGPTRDEAGALIELTRAGREPLTLNDGQQRSFLHDGDVVIFSGWCEKAGFARIGFGRNRGEVLPARRAEN